MAEVKLSTLIVLLMLLLAQLESSRSDENEKASEYKRQFFSSNVVNRHNFKYVYNPGYAVCSKPRGNEADERVFVLIYVHSSPANFKRRQSIRETWSRRSMFRDIRLVFMLGSSPPHADRKLAANVHLEATHYADIVQQDFVDTYRNLTYKAIMAMRWTSTYCPHAKFVLKVDDDIVANMFILLRHLKKLADYRIVNKRTVMCLVWTNMAVMRNPNSKWYLSRDEYEEDKYGKYCSGSAYIFTGDVPALMYNASQYVRFFWVDDYYVTGLLATAINATYVPFNTLYTINTNLAEERFLGKSSAYTVFGHIPNKLNKMYQYWKFIVTSQQNQMPSLKRRDGPASLIYHGDFSFAQDFRWDTNIWSALDQLY